MPYLKIGVCQMIAIFVGIMTINHRILGYPIYLQTKPGHNFCPSRPRI
jgi:hypothetical protein